MGKKNVGAERAKLAARKKTIEAVKLGAQASVSYLALPGDMILIKGIHGVLTKAEIEDRFGKVVATAYLDVNEKCFYRRGEGVTIERSGIDDLTEGVVMSKREFSAAIAAMKAAGSLLHQLVKTVNGAMGNTKTIYI
jgi:hypothetical protein